MLRHRLIVFRMAMTLTGIRKGESRNMDGKIEIADDDFEIAFSYREMLPASFVAGEHFVEA